MVERLDKPITLAYDQVVSTPPTYIATAYPLNEVDWLLITATDVSAVFLGAGITAMLPAVIPIVQRIQNTTVDWTYIYVAIVGAIVTVGSYVAGKWNPRRRLALNKIKAHFHRHGVGAQR
jgi:hypothetical protein